MDGQRKIELNINDDECYKDFESVFSFEHLMESARKCRRNVGWKASVQNFYFELPYNIYEVFDELQSGNFRIKSNYEFNIRERGKIRHIHAVHIRERIVQRCLCDYCLLPLYKKTFIYDNCASLKGKGTEFAINRIKKFLNSYYVNNGSNGYVLIFDFDDFFASISHDKIMEMFRCKITDEKIVALINSFVEMEDGDRGLSLGNEISQVAALMIASPIDHHIKDRCRVKYYLRYMDDGIVIHKNKNFLRQLLKEIEEIADELGLNISKKKTRIVKLSKEFVFLKKKIHLCDNGKIYMKILPASVKRQRRKLKKLKIKLLNGSIKFTDIEASYQSWRSYAIKYDSYESVKSMDELFKELFSGYVKEDKFWTY